MLIEQIIEFGLRKQGLLDDTCTPKLVILMTTQKSLERSSSGLLFTAKIMQEAMYLISSYLGQTTFKI